MDNWQPQTYGPRNSAAAAAIAQVFAEACHPEMTARDWEQFAHDAAKAALEVADG